MVSRQEKRLAAADEMPTAARMIPLWPQKPVARGCVWKYVEGLIGTKSKKFLGVNLSQAEVHVY